MVEGADKAAIQAVERERQRERLAREGAALRRAYWERKAHKYAGI